MIGKEDFYWLNDVSLDILNRGYLLEGVTPQQRIRQIADLFEDNDGTEGIGDKFYKYMSRGYYSLSSPIWSNLGLDRGLPISCFGSYVGDTITDIVGTVAEVSMQSKIGGGTSAYLGHIRPRGSAISNNGTTNGSFPFLSLFDRTVSVISQGAQRRGQFAGYIDVEHPDVQEWLNIKSQGNTIQDIFYAVCITDEWMQTMIDGDVDKRTTWAKILQRRKEFGLPYIFFTDTVNRNTVDVYKDKGMKIHNSNLCAEIALPANEEESFVCCLMSMNLEQFDEWKDTDAVQVAVRFLDTVLDEFIDKAWDMPHMRKAVEFAHNHRAIGLGVLGWHSYLQSKMIPFGSMDAMLENAKVFKLIQDRSYAASKLLAIDKGEPHVLKGYGRRNTTLNALAPTKTSSSILGQVSPSIEPFGSNYEVVLNAKKTYSQRNKYLEKLLEEKGKNTEETWKSILKNNGSVQHLDFLSQHEKDVFKTFLEISQMDIINQAAQRQPFIDQSQSINLKVHPETPTKVLNQLHIEAWKKGVKTLYYQKNVNAAQEYIRDKEECTSCEA